MRQLGDLRNRIDGPHHVRRVAHRDHLRPRRDFTFQVLQIERAIFFANVHLPNDDAFLFQRAPRRHVCVMVQRRHHDFVARFQLSRDGPRQRKRNRGHVLPEHHFVRFAVEEIRHGSARCRNHRVIAPARLECAAGICVRIHVVVLNSFDHLLWHLCPRRPIEKRRSVPVHLQFQGWKLLAYPRNIKRPAVCSLYRRCAHVLLSIED